MHIVIVYICFVVLSFLSRPPPSPSRARMCSSRTTSRVCATASAGAGGRTRGGSSHSSRRVGGGGGEMWDGERDMWMEKRTNGGTYDTERSKAELACGRIELKEKG